MFAVPLIAAGEVVLNHPDHPIVNATGLEQPRLYALLTRDGEVITWEGQEVIFHAFIDTGASGFAISNLLVEYFGFGPDDFMGEYTTLGLGGEEVGDVTRDLGVHVLSGPPPWDGEVTVGDFVDYGEFNLWVRRAPGIGEDIVGFPNPLNIIGMPVIEQRVMVMEWVPYFEEFEMLETQLLDRGDERIPETNITLDLELQDFVGEARPGEVLQSVSKNPLIKDVMISHDPDFGSVTGDWLFDTGAGSSFISFDYARDIGLIDPGDFNPEEFDEYVAYHKSEGGLVSEVGGIGPNLIEVPLLLMNEVRIPAREGFDLVWKDVVITVFDHPELAELGLLGIFGMNLIGPAMTVGNTALESDEYDSVEFETMDDFGDISPSPFRSIVFEVTGEDAAEMRLFTDRDLPEPGEITFESWRIDHFDEAELQDDGISGSLADPGEFGIPNLLRYAFAMDARQPQRDRLPRFVYASDEGAGDSPFSIRFDRRNDVADLEFKVEASPNAIDWSEVESEWHVLESFEDRQRMEVRVQPAPPGVTRYFYRIRIVKE